LIVIALTMVSGSRRRADRGDEEDGASKSQDNPHPDGEHAGNVDTPSDTDALSGIGAVDDWPHQSRGDAERPHLSRVWCQHGPRRDAVNDFPPNYLDTIDERLLGYLDENDELRADTVQRLWFYTSAL